MIKLIDGVEVQLNEQEISARQAEEAAYAASKLAAFLPAYRYQKENGGLTVMGVTIPTDISTRTNLLGAKELATSIKWKTQAGFVDLTAQQVSDIAFAVGSHVQKCFDAEAAVLENIGNYQTEQEIKDAFDAAYLN